MPRELLPGLLILRKCFNPIALQGGIGFKLRIFRIQYRQITATHTGVLQATLAIVEVANYQMHHVMKENKRTSILIGHMWFQELKIGNKNRFFEQFRMRKHVFRELASDLNQKHGLEPMKHVNIEEVVVIKELHIEIQKKDFNILGG